MPVLSPSGPSVSVLPLGLSTVPPPLLALRRSGELAIQPLFSLPCSSAAVLLALTPSNLRPTWLLYFIFISLSHLINSELGRPESGELELQQRLGGGRSAASGATARAPAVTGTRRGWPTGELKLRRRQELGLVQRQEGAALAPAAFLGGFGNTARKETTCFPVVSMDQPQGGGPVSPTKTQEEPSCEELEEELGPATGAGGITEDKMLDEGSTSNRWSQEETLTLLKLRSDMDSAFRRASAKRTLWRVISRKLAEQGFNRSDKMCKEKFHNFYKRTMDPRIWRQDGVCLNLDAAKALSPVLAPPSSSSVASASPPLIPSNVAEMKEEMQRRVLEVLEKWAERVARDEVVHTTLRDMYDLIELAECWIHKDAVANLLQEATDAAYCAEDLLDRLNYYELLEEIERNANQSARTDFFDIKMKEILGKLNHLIAQLRHLGLHDVKLPRFLFTSKMNYDHLTYETIIGRQEELQVLIDLFVLRENSPTGGQVTGAAEALDGDGARSENLSVLSIVGDGGIGKTALAHCTFNDKIVQNHFDLLVWICVSDGFDEKKLINRLAWSVTESEMKSDDLSCLQRILTNGIIHHSRKLLLVLDDLQEDVCQDSYRGWERFLAHLKCARLGSKVLVTTRSMKVAEHISKRPLQLEGLQEETTWILFNTHAFDLHMRKQEVDCIFRKIVARLNGSPLGAKILGRLLNLKLDVGYLNSTLNVGYWKSILESELWLLGHQKESRIWPALQWSYQHLPFHLKRCFSFCSLYPKGHEFDAETLVDSWAAVGLVVSRGSTPAVDIGHVYFDQLVRLSFFQKSPTSSSSRHAYVLQGLLYDMAQQISINECFVIKHSGDLLRIPPKVRHVSILSYSGLSSSDLESLSKYRALRSVVCISIDSNVITTSVLETWLFHLTNIRMLRFISCRLKELPENIGELICLRYLDVSSCNFEALPDSFWRLHNLENLDAQNCGFHGVPKNIVKLVNLRKVRLKGDLINQLGRVPGVGKLVLLQEMPYYAVDDMPGRGIQELKNLNHLRGTLEISGLHNVTSKEQAAGADLNKKMHLNTLVLSWHDSIRPDKHNGDQEMEVLEGLEPSCSIKHLEVRFYMGSEFHPRWLNHPINYYLKSLSISFCPNVANLLVVKRASSSSGVFLSLTKLCITWCRRLRSLEPGQSPAAGACRSDQGDTDLQLRGVSVIANQSEGIRSPGGSGGVPLLEPQLGARPCPAQLAEIAQAGSLRRAHGLDARLLPA
ncbi:hypothetical protein ABZP36_036060 [Zizania latifolia]